MFNQFVIVIIAAFLSFSYERKVSRYSVIDVHFNFGSDQLTAENKIEMDSLINSINRYDGNELLYYARARTCQKEFEKYPNLGIIRAKKVLDYMQPKILKKDRKLYIDPNYIVEKYDCEKTEYSNLISVMLVAVRK